MNDRNEQNRLTADEIWMSELSRIAAIRLSGEETAYCMRELNKMLDLLASMNDPDVSADWRNGAVQCEELRQDKPGICMSREQALFNAPAQDGTCILVSGMREERGGNA